MLRGVPQLVRLVFSGRTFLNCADAGGTRRIPQSWRRWAFLAALATVVAVMNCGPVWAQSWTAGSGDWSTPGDWNPSGIPNGGYVNIINSDSVNRVVTYDSGVTMNEFALEIDQTGSGSNTLVATNLGYMNFSSSVTIGYNGQGAFTNNDANINISNNLNLGSNPGSSGTYTATDGFLGVGGTAYVGYGGSGTATLQGETSGNCGAVILGNDTTGNGMFNLSGSYLTVSGNLTVGLLGAGTFSETTANGAYSYNTVDGELDIAASSGSTGAYTIGAGGGSLSVGTGLYVGGSSSGAGGHGTLTIGAGSTVSVGTVPGTGTLQIYPGSANSVTLNGGTINLGSFLVASPSQFHWNSGTVAFSGSLTLDSLVGNFTGNSLTLQTGMTLASGYQETVGYSSNTTATLTQNGGTNTVGTQASPFSLNLGGYAGSAGIYNISGGSLSVSSAMYVGEGYGAGTFHQTGGTVTVAQGIELALFNGSTGTYSLSAGTLTSGGTEDVSAGGFNQSGGTNTITGDHDPYYNYTGVALQIAAPYNLSGGVLTVSGGDEGIAGVFTQSAGSNTISGGNNLCVGSTFDYYAETGTYTLSGGSFSIGGNAYVGGTEYGALGTGALNVSESTGSSLLSIAGTLKVFPGSTLSLSYGEIQTGKLDLSGNYSAFNWYLGTLELTNTAVVLDSTVVGPTNPLGAALVITNLQTLIVDLSEQIGGVGPGSLTVNGTHVVEGTLTLNPTGTLTVGSGGSLSFGAFVQAGGTANGTITNTGSFTYQSGLFNGRLVNQGTVSLGTNFTAGNGIENDASMIVSGTQRLIVNGQGFDNLGTLTISGGTIAGGGGFTNDYGGLMTATGGTIDQSIDNNGTLNVNGVFAIGGGVNYGQINIGAGGNLRPAPGAGGFVNEPGGVVQGGGGALTMSFGNYAGGEVVVPAGNSLSITGTWDNAGLVTLEGTGAALNGGTITNSSIIQGVGHIGAAVLNTGVVTASGGELDLDGTGNTNTSTGQIQAPSGSTVLYLQGLATNSGIIALSGGTFSNGNQPLANASGASIEGSGTLETGGLTSAGSVYFANNPTSVYGSVATTSGGTFTIANNTTTFYGAVTVGSGSTFTANKATATFLNTFTNNGTFISDPSTLGFTSLVIGASGTVQASAGDLYQVTGNFTNASTQSSTWNAAGATLQFTGGGTHTMNVSGSVGSYGWGTLQVASGNTVQINGNSATATVTNNSGTIDQTSGSSASLGVVSGAASSSGGATVYIGNLIVGDGSNPSELTASQILQTTLTINAGSTVTIAPSGSGIPAVEASDSVASDSNVVAADSTSSSDSGADSSSDPFLAIQAAIASGAISSVKGKQLDNRLAAIERLAATDPGLDVGLLESRVLSSLPSSVWSAADASYLVETGSSLRGVESGMPDSDSDGATAAFSPAAGVGSPAAVPEPSALLLATLGGVGFAVAARRRGRITGRNR